ncbi:Transcription initiation factor IIB, partial [Lunasporangiospora selenospora]
MGPPRRDLMQNMNASPQAGAYPPRHMMTAEHENMGVSVSAPAVENPKPTPPGSIRSPSPDSANQQSEKKKRGRKAKVPVDDANQRPQPQQLLPPQQQQQQPLPPQQRNQIPPNQLPSGQSRDYQPPYNLNHERPEIIQQRPTSITRTPSGNRAPGGHPPQEALAQAGPPRDYEAGHLEAAVANALVNIQHENNFQSQEGDGHLDGQPVPRDAHQGHPPPPRQRRDNPAGPGGPRSMGAELAEDEQLTAVILQRMMNHRQVVEQEEAARIEQQQFGHPVSPPLRGQALLEQRGPGQHPFPGSYPPSYPENDRRAPESHLYEDGQYPYDQQAGPMHGGRIPPGPPGPHGRGGDTMAFDQHPETMMEDGPPRAPMFNGPPPPHAQRFPHENVENAGPNYDPARGLSRYMDVQEEMHQQQQARGLGHNMGPHPRDEEKWHEEMARQGRPPHVGYAPHQYPPPPPGSQHNHMNDQPGGPDMPIHGPPPPHPSSFEQGMPQALPSPVSKAKPKNKGKPKGASRPFDTDTMEVDTNHYGAARPGSSQDVSSFKHHSGENKGPFSPTGRGQLANDVIMREEGAHMQEGVALPIGSHPGHGGLDNPPSSLLFGSGMILVKKLHDTPDTPGSEASRQFPPAQLSAKANMELGNGQESGPVSPTSLKKKRSQAVMDQGDKDGENMAGSSGHGPTSPTQGSSTEFSPPRPPPKGKGGSRAKKPVQTDEGIERSNQVIRSGGPAWLMTGQNSAMNQTNSTQTLSNGSTTSSASKANDAASGSGASPGQRRRPPQSSSTTTGGETEKRKPKRIKIDDKDVRKVQRSSSSSLDLSSPSVKPDPASNPSSAEAKKKASELDGDQGEDQGLADGAEGEDEVMEEGERTNERLLDDAGPHKRRPLGDDDDEQDDPDGAMGGSSRGARGGSGGARKGMKRKPNSNVSGGAGKKTKEKGKGGGTTGASSTSKNQGDSQQQQQQQQSKTGHEESLNSENGTQGETQAKGTSNGAATTPREPGMFKVPQTSRGKGSKSAKSSSKGDETATESEAEPEYLPMEDDIECPHMFGIEESDREKDPASLSDDEDDDESHAQANGVSVPNKDGTNGSTKNMTAGLKKSHGAKLDEPDVVDPIHAQGRDWVKRLAMPESTWEETFKTYEKVKRLKELKNRQPVRKRNAILAAILYIVCRDLGSPRTFSEICTASGVKRGDVGTYYRLLLKILEPAINATASARDTDAEAFMNRWCDSLSLPAPIRQAAVHVFSLANTLNLTS